MRPYWHYTTGMNMLAIVADGMLRPGVHRFGLLLPGERPALYCTRRQTWEPTANKGVWGTNGPRTLTTAETEEAGQGLYRIAVPAALLPYTWIDFVREGGLSYKATQGLERSARRHGARPKDEWRLTYAPVSLSDCTAVEAWNGDVWVGNLMSAAGVSLPMLNGELAILRSVNIENKRATPNGVAH